MDDINKTRNIDFGITICNEVFSSVPYLFCGDLCEGISFAKKNNYDGVELHIGDPNKIDIRKVQNCCTNLSTKVCGISTGLSYYYEKLCLIDDDKINRKGAINRLKDYIDLSEKIGGYVIVGNMRGKVPNLNEYKKYSDRLSESMKEVCEYALKKDVEILIEATNRYESNYLNNADELNAFIETYKIPKLKMLLDTFHMNIEETEIIKIIKKYCKNLGYFHVSDNNRMYPGRGSLNFNSIIDTLVDINYTGYIVLECLPIPNKEVACKEALKVLKK